MKSGWAIALSLALVAIAPVTRAAEKEKPIKMVVLDLEAKGVNEALARSATDALLTSLHEIKGYKVLGRDEIKTILEHEGEKQALGCTDYSCIADIGELLKCDTVLSGSIGLVGNAYLLTVSLMDVKKATVIARASATALSADEIPDAANKVALELISPEKVKEQKTGYSLNIEGGEAKVAVLDLKAIGPAKEVAENLTQVVVVELKEFKGLSVISKDEIKSMLSFEQDKQLLGCDDASCLTEIGGALGVGYIVSGNVGKMENTFLLHLKLINIREASIENRVAESFQGGEGQLVGAARFAARKLLGRYPQGEGTLEVRPSISEAKLLLDGQESEPGKEQPIKSGKYNIRLEADGYYPWIGDVYVDEGQLTRLDVNLSELPEAWYEKWWVWTIAGVLVVGATSLGLYYGLSGDENTGSLDVGAGLPGGAR